MPSPLNRIPSGLLEYFGIKSGEWGPRELGQQLVPTLDLWRHYCASSRAIQFDIGCGSSLGPQATTGLVTRAADDLTTNPVPGVIPADELWYADFLIARATFNAVAGSTLNGLALEAFDSNNGIAGIVPSSPLPGNVISSAGQAVGTFAATLYPQWLLPGMTLAVRWGGLIGAGGSLTLRLSGRVTRLKI